MKIAGQRIVLHVYDLRDSDRDCLKSQGYEFFENDMDGNEMWDKEENYFVGDREEDDEEMCVPDEEDIELFAAMSELNR